MKTRLFLRGIALAQFPHAFVPGIGLLRGHHLGEVHALEPRKSARGLQRRFLVELAALFHRQDASVLRALFAQQARQAARINPGDADQFVAAHEFRQRLGRAEIAVRQRQIADHETGGIDTAGFHVLGIGPGVADVGIGERDDLARVGGIAEDFLVAGHGGVEHHLAHRLPRNANGLPVEQRAIFQCQQCGRHIP